MEYLQTFIKLGPWAIVAMMFIEMRSSLSDHATILGEINGSLQTLVMVLSKGS